MRSLRIFRRRRRDRRLAAVHGRFRARSTGAGAGAHDAVTAKLIVEEAGGKVTSILGDDQRYDEPVRGAIFSNGHLHQQLVDIAVKNKT